MMCNQFPYYITVILTTKRRKNLSDAARGSSLLLNNEPVRKSHLYLRKSRRRKDQIRDITHDRLKCISWRGRQLLPVRVTAECRPLLVHLADIAESEHIGEIGQARPNERV